MAWDINYRYNNNYLTADESPLPKPPPIPPRSLRGQLTQGRLHLLAKTWDINYRSINYLTADRSPVPMQPFIPSDSLYGKQFAATQGKPYLTHNWH